MKEEKVKSKDKKQKPKRNRKNIHPSISFISS